MLAGAQMRIRFSRSILIRAHWVFHLQMELTSKACESSVKPVSAYAFFIDS